MLEFCEVVVSCVCVDTLGRDGGSAVSPIKPWVYSEYCYYTMLFYVVVVVLCSQVDLSCAAHQCHDMKRRSAALIHRYYYIVPSSMRSFFIFVHVTEGGFVEPYSAL